jgi:hypothetical protein
MCCPVDFFNPPLASFHCDVLHAVSHAVSHAMSHAMSHAVSHAESLSFAMSAVLLTTLLTDLWLHPHLAGWMTTGIILL